MKYGIIIDMHDEEKQDELTKALYEYFRYNTESMSESMDVTLMSELIFMPQGLIIIDVKDPVRCNGIELTWAVQRFLRGYEVSREDIVSIDLIDIRWVGSMIAGNQKVEASKEEAPKLEDLLSALANNYYVKYASFINNGDYTTLLNKLEQDCISSDFCLYKNNDDYSARCYYLCENEKKRIAVYIESIDTIDDLSKESDRLVYKCKPVCFKVKAIHLDSDKCATRILWGEDPLIE